MTAREMQISFMKQLTAISETFEYPNIEDSDTIFYWINTAQNKYLKETYLAKQTAKGNVEFIQKRLEDLKQLVNRMVMFGTKYIISGTEPSTAITLSSPGSSRITFTQDGAVAFPLPADYFYYIRSTSKLSGTYLNSVIKTWFNNNLIEQSDIDSSILTNAINTPIIRTPLVVLEQSPVTGDTSKSYMLLYKDSYSNLFNVELTYIRNPKVITLVVTDSNNQTTECELSTQTHPEIIEYALKLYIEDYKFKLSSKGGSK